MEPVSELPKYDGRGFLVPFHLWDSMARLYFSGDREMQPLTPDGTYVGVPEFLFGKMCLAFYGDGETYAQSASPTTQVDGEPEEEGSVGGEGKVAVRAEIMRFVPKSAMARAKAGMKVASNAGDDSASER
jgi:hypothetical protein